MEGKTIHPSCSKINRRHSFFKGRIVRKITSRFYCSVEYPNTEMQDKFYYIDEDSSNSTHTVFACYPNFNQVAGDVVRICVDNRTWEGEELQCEVDPLMDKYRLSGAIVASVFMLFFCILLPNFAKFHVRRHELRHRRHLVKHYVMGNEYYQYNRRMMQAKMTASVVLYGSAVDVPEYETNEEYLVEGFERKRGLSKSLSSKAFQAQSRARAGLNMLSSAFPRPRRWDNS